MMNLLRLSTVQISRVPAPVLRSVILVTGVACMLAISGQEGLLTSDAAPRADINASSDSLNEGLAGTLQSSSLQPGSMPNDDRVQTRPDQPQRAMAGPSLASAGEDVSITLNLPQPDVATAPTPAQQPSPIEDVPPAEQASPNEAAPVQLASVNPSEVDLSDIQPDSKTASQAPDTGKTVKSIEIMDECFVVEICVDRYLWQLYERTAKEDSIKQVEWRKVTVERKIKVKGKIKTRTVTVSKAFTKLVDQDFTWKDPKAAERAGMPMKDYVIGGMDRRFKLKLFHMLHAAEAAGLSPGITSAFRDDYRQSIASGLKAASNRSYHGGSLRGGYGHGVAADVVSVDGATRNARWASSDRLWKWVDAHGKEFGIARPYLGRDPPHVAPVDGQEYAKHSRGTKLAASDAKKKADAKKADAKTVSVKQAASNVKNASAKQAAADLKVGAKKGEAKKPNLVIMRDGSRPAKRAAARDVRPLSKRAAARPANARQLRQAQR